LWCEGEGPSTGSALPTVMPAFASKADILLRVAAEQHGLKIVMVSDSHAGMSFGTVKTDVNGAPIFWTQPGVSGQITPGFGFSDQTYPAAFIGGGQIGYNWQYSP
jgi:hypothetical protein